MKTRLKDIAKTTGFSVNTVSHALRDLPDISEETKKIIRSVADKLDYIPNIQASGFKSGKSKMISIILPDIINPHFSIVFREIEDHFRNQGITPIFINTNERDADEINAVRLSISQNVDGVIICPVQNSIEGIKLLEKSKIPFVLIGRHFDNEINTNYVVCDDINGAYIATKYLIDNGHRNIACVRVGGKISSDRERYLGYCRALDEAGIEINKENIIKLSVRENTDNVKIIDEFFKFNRNCTAVLSFNDIIAYQIISVLNRLNINVPKDISVIGFDNICSEYSFPLMLSSVSISKKKMAHIASALLTKKMNTDNLSDETVKEHIILPTKLYLRDTTKSNQLSTHIPS